MKKRYVEIKVRPDTEAQKNRFDRAARASRRSLSKWMVEAAERYLVEVAGRRDERM